MPPLASPADATRVLHPTNDRPLRFVFPPKDLARLQRPQAMLSDDCINSGAEVLLRKAQKPPSTITYCCNADASNPGYVPNVRCIIVRLLGYYSNRPCSSLIWGLSLNLPP